jgi:hypothetical protein
VKLTSIRTTRKRKSDALLAVMQQLKNINLMCPYAHGADSSLDFDDAADSLVGRYLQWRKLLETDRDQLRAEEGSAPLKKSPTNIVPKWVVDAMDRVDEKEASVDRYNLIPSTWRRQWHFDQTPPDSHFRGMNYTPAWTSSSRSLKRVFLDIPRAILRASRSA